MCTCDVDNKELKKKKKYQEVTCNKLNLSEYRIFVRRGDVLRPL